MKYIEWIMLTIQVVVVAVICFAVFGCANLESVEENKRETAYRKAELNAWQDKSDLSGKEWEEYESTECEYDDSIMTRLFDSSNRVKLDEIKLTEDEMPKYTILELGNGKTKIVWQGDGEDPRKKKKKVAGFTVPEADPTDCIGDVCRGDAVPYLSNYFATGNVEGEQQESFREWYEKEIRRTKMRKYLAQNQKYGLDFYKCKTVTNTRAKDANKPIEMPQEWIDQWPSTRQVNEQIENSIIGVHQ